jgi:hypothetical protein
MNDYKTEGKYENIEIGTEEYNVAEETKPQEKEKPKKLTFEETWGCCSCKWRDIFITCNY